MSDRRVWDEVVKENLSQYGEFGVSTELDDNCARVHLYSQEDLTREDMKEIGKNIRDALMPGGQYDFSINEDYYNIRVASSETMPQGHL